MSQWDGTMQQDSQETVVVPREPVAWRVRRKTDDPEEWQLRPAGAALDFGNPDRWEIQPLYAAAPASPDPLLEEAVGNDRFYIDCEFDGHNGPLLSMALVHEDGDGIHIRVDIEPMDIWVRRNVLPLMDRHEANRSVTVYPNNVGTVIRNFIGNGSSPTIITDSLQDSRYFSQAMTTAPDGGYAPCPFERVTFEVHNIDCYPTDLEGAVQHNAWWDAMALRAFLAKLGRA